jgi:peptidoglycan/xylan/chitin deacetylase (PgdA/CDA1 family)
MTLFNLLKVRLYNFFTSPIGRYILRSLVHFVYVKTLEKYKKGKKKKFIVALTIDTESGYTNKDNSRVWQASRPDAYIGYYKGIENWRKLLNKYNAKATFFLCTNGFSAKGNDYNKVISQLKLLSKENHEIGLHTHPDSDLALQKCLKKKCNATSARFYNKGEIKKIILESQKLMRKHIGQKVSSFRWGNWALDTNAVKVLNEAGIKVDSSATPGIKGHIHDTMHYDWSKVSNHHPWRLSLNNYQNTTQNNSKILELPIATFNFMGLTLRADPVYSVLLKAAFDYYYKNAERSDKPFVFVVISHSIEGTHEDGSVTRVIKDTEDFIKHAKKFDDVEFVTMKDAYNRVK